MQKRFPFCGRAHVPVCEMLWVFTTQIPILLWLRIPRHGIICSVSECEPQAKHEFSGIDTLFLSEHERYAKWELRNMV